MEEIKNELKPYGISVKIDDRDNVRSGFKFAEWELKGVPVRVVMGKRDLENGVVEIARRDTCEKSSVSREGIAEYIKNLLDEIQKNIYAKALNFREEHTVKVDTWEEFKEKIEEGGFLLCHWDGTPETEEKIKEETKATIRCIPVDSAVCVEEGKCIYSGKPSSQRVLFAISY
jgi:prolyl-tRNA synthetase